VTDARIPQVRLEVADEGIGLTPEQQARVFDAFEQGDNSLTRQYGGAGLGLAICKHLARRMGGVLGVDSTPGQGSTFWITVPLEPPPADAGAERKG
jgi:signal transduction histidine kinase